MRIIAVTLSLLSFFCLSMTMVAGLKAGHGEAFFMSHLNWAFGSLALLLLTIALCLMFIFKMHGIIHELVQQLDAKDSVQK